MFPEFQGAEQNSIAITKFWLFTITQCKDRYCVIYFLIESILLWYHMLLLWVLSDKFELCLNHLFIMCAHTYFCAQWYPIIVLFFCDFKRLSLWIFGPMKTFGCFPFSVEDLICCYSCYCSRCEINSSYKKSKLFCKLQL